MDRMRQLARSDDLYHTRRFEYGQPIVEIETAKQISREERQLHFLGSVEPSLRSCIQRQKLYIAFISQNLGGRLFLARLYAQCIPSVVCGFVKCFLSFLMH